MITYRAKKVFFAAAISACVSGGVFGGSFWYVLMQGDVLQARAQAVADHTTQIKTYQGLERLLADSITERNMMDNYVLNESATIDFLSEIEQVAAQSGVIITTDTLTVTKATNFNTLLVQFTLQGSEAQVAAMIQILETLPYKSQVDALQLRIDSAREQPVSAVIKLAVSLSKV